MIIALTGLKQSGKSTVAKHLQEKYGFIRINFKDALLQELKTYFPDFLSAEASYHACTIDELLEKKPGHIRQLLQNFGTELRRNEDKNYWTRNWNYKVEYEKRTTNRNIVVDDCRFLNEAGIVKADGGVIVRVIKIGQVSNDSHGSEMEMNKIEPDYIVSAEPGCNELLLLQIDNIMRDML